MKGENAAGASNFGDRLQSALGGLSQAVVAKRAGVSTSSMSQYVQGREPGLFVAARLASVLDVSLEWLATGKGAPRASDDILLVPRYDATLAAGAGSWNEGRSQLDSIPFTADFFRKRFGRTSATGFAVLEARGDSMEPNIPDGSLLLIDERDVRLSDGIFAFVLDGEARLKRFRRTLSGWMILSDNAAYEPEEVVGDQLAGIQVIGRLRWYGKEVRWITRPRTPGC